MKDLKPCPFCGGEAKVHKADVPFYRMHKEGWYVMCHGRECCADLGFGGEDYQGTSGMFGTEAEAIEAWNTRHERTCRNVAENKEKWFICGECLYECSRPTMVKFCFNCGARVVKE